MKLLNWETNKQFLKKTEKMMSNNKKQKFKKGNNLLTKETKSDSMILHNFEFLFFLHNLEFFKSFKLMTNISIENH